VVKTRAVEAEHVREALQMAGLERLYERYGTESLFTLRKEWDDVLSPGEQQRLNFARLFLRLLLLRSRRGHEPRGPGDVEADAPVFAVLDEATSFMDEPMERRIYAQCQREGLTLISVGHRSSLRNYHHSLLLLSGEEDDDDDDGSDPHNKSTTHAAGPTWTICSLPSVAGSARLHNEVL
jgi:ABC-type uncharacterized transport system fused permease/ATPase subunit